MNAFSRIKGLLEIQSALGKLQNAIQKYQIAKENGMSLSFGQLLKSKTFWTGVAGFAFNAWNQYGSTLPLSPAMVTVVNGGIALGVAVFRMFPTQQPTPTGNPAASK